MLSRPRTAGPHRPSPFLTTATSRALLFHKCILKKAILIPREHRTIPYFWQESQDELSAHENTCPFRPFQKDVLTTPKKPAWANAALLANCITSSTLRVYVSTSAISFPKARTVRIFPMRSSASWEGNGHASGGQGHTSRFPEAPSEHGSPFQDTATDTELCYVATSKQVTKQRIQNHLTLETAHLCACRSGMRPTGKREKVWA